MRDALDARIFGREGHAVGQRAVVHFDNKVATALKEAAIDSGQVITTVGIGFDQQTFDSGQTHARYTELTGVLVAVAVNVVEHLADDRGLLDVRVRHNRHAGTGRVTHRDTTQQRRRRVDVFALCHTRTDAQDIAHGRAAAHRNIDAAKVDGSLTVNGKRAVAHQTRGVFNKAETGRQIVADGQPDDRLHANILGRDRVGDQLTDRALTFLGRLAQTHLEVAARRIQRNVVINHIRIAVFEHKLQEVDR